MLDAEDGFWEWYHLHKYHKAMDALCELLWAGDSVGLDFSQQINDMQERLDVEVSRAWELSDA